MTVDFICHGVPSPKVWKKYLQEVVDKISFDTTENLTLNSIKKISFRDKTEGWKKFSFKLEFKTNKNEKVIFRENLDENIFLRGFLRDLYLRPSCHDCPVKSLKSGSDITIADFWGIENVIPDFDDNKGTSLVLINSMSGRKICSNLPMVFTEIELDKAICYNPSLVKSSIANKKRDKFMYSIDDKLIIELINNLLRISLLEKISNISKAVLHKFNVLKRKEIMQKRKIGI